MLTPCVFQDAAYLHIYSGATPETFADLHRDVCAHREVGLAQLFVQLLLTLIVALLRPGSVPPTVAVPVVLSAITVLADS